MENSNISGFDHNEAEDRRDYGESHNANEEGSVKPYADSTERPHRSYSSNYEGRGNYGHDSYGSSSRRSYKHADRPYRSYSSSDEEHSRPRYNNQHRSYGQGSSDEGYNRPRYNSRSSYGQGSSEEGGYNNQRRSYNNSDEGYSRPRYNSRSSYGQGSSEEGGYNNQRRSYNNSDEGYNRPRYNNQRRSYGQGSSDEGGYNGQRRSYNNSDEGYSRPRYNNQRRSYGQGSSEDGYRPRRNNNYGGNNQYGSSRPRKSYTEDGDVPRYSSYSEKPIRGTKLRPRKNKPQAQPVESGIDKMIKRNPQLTDATYSDNDLVNVPVKDVVRLNKFIANSGICSRREADNFIQAGVVTVNGEVVTELGSKVNVNTDDVRFNGERLRGEEKVYIVMNKPKGFVTTASDPHADKTVLDLIKGCPARVFPVGRLDKNTTGVLMFTNDGEIAEKLTHPSYDKKKIYQATLTNPLEQEDYDKILAGVTLSDGEIAADALEYVDENDHRKIGIEIHSGKNRIVRRIFESLGYTVKNLDRVYFAGLTKKGIKRGGWRYLTEGEANVLKMGAYN